VKNVGEGFSKKKEKEVNTSKKKEKEGKLTTLVEGGGNMPRKQEKT